MSRIRDVVCAIVIVIIGITSTSIAYGQESTPNGGEKSAVLIIDSGSADLILESSVRATTESILVDDGYTIVENVEVAGDKPARLLACSGQLECVVEVLSGIPASVVVFVSMRSDEQESKISYKIVARIFEVNTGRAVARVMKRCEACVTELDLAPFAEGVIEDLLLSEKTTTPELAIDNSAPAPLATSEGESQNPRAEVSIGKSRTSKAPKAQSPVLPFIGIGGGVSLFGAGVVLAYLDGPVIQNGLRQPEARETALAGYGLMGAGGILIGVGAWLLFRQKDTDSDSASSLVLAPTRSGAQLVWGGDF